MFQAIHKQQKSDIAHTEPNSRVLEQAIGTENTTYNSPVGLGHNFSKIPVYGSSPHQVQRKIGTENRQDNPQEIHKSASMGFHGAPRPFPFLTTIQQSFGPHDISKVKAYVGGAARQATDRMGAAAYATRERVAFGQAPDLHTAAHEAAHIVQQRAGIQLREGIGQTNDTHEQHADAVADAVVKRQSVQPLLNRYAGRSGSFSNQVQRQVADGNSERYDSAQAGQPRYSGPRPAPQPSSGAGTPHIGIQRLQNGIMQWALVPQNGYVNARIEFIPNSPAVAGRTISFIQTVSTQDTTGGFLGLFTTTYATRPEVDASPGDSEPFYGANWDRAAGRWGDEPTATQARPGDYQGRGGAREGSRPYSVATGRSAVLNDSPMLQVRQGKDFETVAVVVETGEVLGSLSWFIQRWSEDSTIVRRATCREGSTGGFQGIVDNFYSNRSGTIELTDFADGSADLPANHSQVLLPILTRLRAEPTRGVIVGGSATQGEAGADALSRTRAERVRAYLVSQGIAESRITIDVYGSSWARVPSARPGAGAANRRVQVRIQ